jgi:uncharacterized protein (TIGR00645 family)
LTELGGIYLLGEPSQTRKTIIMKLKGKRLTAKVEELFESSLYSCRFLVIFAVIGTMVAAAILFLKGTVEMLQGVNGFIRHVDISAQTVSDDKTVILAFIPAIDNYLFATVLLIFSMGIYELFVSKIDPSMKTPNSRPNWLNIDNLDDLKTHIAEVVIMILIINFFEFSFTVTLSKPADLLFFAGSILIVAATLYISHNMIQHRRKRSDSKATARNDLGVATNSPDVRVSL